MPKAKTDSKKPKKSFEETLWDTANKLRGSVESSEYKHVVLSLIFLKFVSDKFEERRAELVAEGKEEDTVGRVYEYFLGKFAASEGKLGGEF
jgi:type I restriction enzyme M protein